MIAGGFDCPSGDVDDFVNASATDGLAGSTSLAKSTGVRTASHYLDGYPIVNSFGEGDEPIGKIGRVRQPCNSSPLDVIR